ncbi:histidine kinase/DNA gyrase B/HSP90-like ATPase [Asanoa ferruginea]|uniref:Sensor-like histidine kinase SenX3 n=2 Tax=Asanoa ferruginea TaxID=53367 RepID=A0A3D9ZQM9_9ACTN|nr:HAMP domain-containing sensor histidine kinase [Asanoa ferruginea]REF99668.1 histidine kinase/DNA gyrase B/HSP90-like ATPase [Asanoa ferruginea]GIF52075.1 two-component sensor histidine kinase [Asanoa ferruginea]
MHDLAVMLALAFGAALAVGAVGAAALRLLRRRSITVHVTVLLATTVVAVVAGVTAVAEAMFLSTHDLEVVIITVSAAAVVSLGVGVAFGRRLAAAAVWADHARARERRLEKERRDLVAWVSHDLRTPLAGLRAMAEALEDGVVDDTATVAEYHRRIRIESDRMARLVDDLFELSRINAGALRLSLSTVPLGDVVSDALATAAPLAAARRIRLEAGQDGWPTVTASEPELARVVVNLVLNAVRYTPQDGTVRVEAGREDDATWLAVADTCGGIPPLDLPHVFDVAFRGEPARTPPTGDATASGGIGLAIVHGLVEAHGGSVKVENTADGCRFLVRLPAA